MHISQILILDGVATYPPSIQHCIESIRHLLSEGLHTIYNENKLAKFISNNFNNSAARAYDRLISNAYKADLDRRCLFCRLGARCFDIAIKPFQHIEFSSDVDLIVETPFSHSNGIIYSNLNNSVFDEDIDLGLKNCEFGFYGVNALCPTSSSLFGQAVASQGQI